MVRPMAAYQRVEARASKAELPCGDVLKELPRMRLDHTTWICRRQFVRSLACAGGGLWTVVVTMPISRCRRSSHTSLQNHC